MSTETKPVFPPSILTKKQIRIFGPKPISGWGPGALIKAKVRFDDECGNGHNTFSITGDIYIPGRRDIEAGGCLHKEIAEHFPELAPFIKWHLCSTDGPLHYIANTVYHADEHGPTHAWIYYRGTVDPLNLDGEKERLVGYEKAEIVHKAETTPSYRVKWDEKTVKVRNLEYARASAVWPDATDAELTEPGLEQRLLDRLPELMKEFKQAVESLGLIY